ncbi:MAG: hypothetical protein RLZZ44_931 [Bacteroidota bacterium]|jgi:hypothetical protein
MNKNRISSDRSRKDFYNRVSARICGGFIIKEKNEKLPFVVLSRKPRNINHAINFVLFCLTFGLWSIAWMYMTVVYGKEKRIIIAIDEDGKIVEETCY